MNEEFMVDELSKYSLFIPVHCLFFSLKSFAYSWYKRLPS